MNRDPIYLTWLNYLGGFEYWLFTARKDNNIEVVDTGETTQNIFAGWPKSYGAYADTIRKQTHRISREQKIIRSQYLSLDEINALKYIRTSPLVQIVNSRTDRRTVIVDNQSFVIYQDEAKLYNISFTITYTDNIPSQHV